MGMMPTTKISYSSYDSYTKQYLGNYRGDLDQARVGLGHATLALPAQQTERAARMHRWSDENKGSASH